MSNCQRDSSYQQLLELFPDALAIHDGEKILCANTATAKLFGAGNAEELINKPLVEMLPHDFLEDVREQTRSARNEGNNVPYIEKKFVLFDWTVIDAEVAFSPLISRERHVKC